MVHVVTQKLLDGKCELRLSFYICDIQVCPFSRSRRLPSTTSMMLVFQMLASVIPTPLLSGSTALSRAKHPLPPVVPFFHSIFVIAQQPVQVHPCSTGALGSSAQRAIYDPYNLSHWRSLWIGPRVFPDPTWAQVKANVFFWSLVISAFHLTIWRGGSNIIRVSQLQESKVILGIVWRWWGSAGCMTKPY